MKIKGIYLSALLIQVTVLSAFAGKTTVFDKEEKRLFSDEPAVWESSSPTNDGIASNDFWSNSDGDDNALFAPPTDTGDGQKLTDDEPIDKPLSTESGPATMIFLLLLAGVYGVLRRRYFDDHKESGCP